MSGVPVSSRGATFNGGTITAPLVIDTGDPNTVPLTIASSWNAQNTDFLLVQNKDNGVKLVNVDLNGNLLCNHHVTEVRGSELTPVGVAALAGGFTGPVTVNPTTDVVCLTVVPAATATANPLSVEDKTGANALVVGATGVVATRGDTIDTDATHLGFYGKTPTVQQTGVAVTAAALHAALVNLGLITA
jgi:hypothetical protein